MKIAMGDYRPSGDHLQVSTIFGTLPSVLISHLESAYNALGAFLEDIDKEKRYDVDALDDFRRFSVLICDDFRAKAEWLTREGNYWAEIRPLTKETNLLFKTFASSVELQCSDCVIKIAEISLSRSSDMTNSEMLTALKSLRERRKAAHSHEVQRTLDEIETEANNVQQQIDGCKAKASRLKASLVRKLKTLEMRCNDDKRLEHKSLFSE